MRRIDPWLNQLIASGKSLLTVRAYAWHVRTFAKFNTLPVEAIRAADLTRYLAEQRLHGWSESSVKLSVNALRSFFTFAVGKRRSPARTVKAPRPKPHPQRTLTAGQAIDVIASCDTSKPIGQRDLALLCLMLDTGLRSREVCNLPIDNLKLDERRLWTVVKGGAVQPKAFTRYTAAQLDRWLQMRPAIARPEIKTVFVGIGGLKPGTSLTGYGLRSIFRSIARAAGLARFSPHDLRRSFATLTIRFGASSRLVQTQGGWNNPEELMRYTQALELEDIEPFLPVGRLMGL